MVACRARLRLYRPGGQTFGEASAPGVTSQNRVVGCCPITILGRCINTVNINYIKGVWKTTVVTKVLRGWKDNQRQSLNQRQRWGHVNSPSTWLRAPTDGCAKALRLSTREGQRLWCLPQNSVTMFGQAKWANITQALTAWQLLPFNIWTPETFISIVPVKHCFAVRLSSLCMTYLTSTRSSVVPVSV